jgi:hypothetical protein
MLSNHLSDYIELMDRKARVARPGKRGSLTADVPQIVSLLRLDHDKWLGLGLEIQNSSLRAIGTFDRLYN